MVVFYTKTTYITCGVTIQLWPGFTSLSIKDTQCITPHALSVITSICQSKLKCHLFWFMCYFKCDALAITTILGLLLKYVAKNLRLVYMHDCCLLSWIEPFKSAAVQSDQSQEFKFVQFPDSTNCSWIANRGNIGSVFLLWIKACNGWLCPLKGVKEERGSSLFLLSWHKTWYA